MSSSDRLASPLLKLTGVRCRIELAVGFAGRHAVAPLLDAKGTSADLDPASRRSVPA
jgi:hypothetical protein